MIRFPQNFIDMLTFFNFIRHRVQIVVFGEVLQHVDLLFRLDHLELQELLPLLARCQSFYFFLDFYQLVANCLLAARISFAFKTVAS